ncbi:MAG: YfiR family protein [Flavobacteriales bacterium]|nr:YfiR family protein [Flavobacteriales bacterium]
MIRYLNITPFYLLVFFILLFSFSKETNAQEVNYKSYSLFVYNFIKYIDWPDLNPEEDFKIAVIGDSPVLKELQYLSQNKRIRGKRMVVKQYADAESISDCNLIYICSHKSSSIKILKEKYKNKPVLLIGEREGLAKKGAALSFVTLENDALHFDVNKKVLENHNLKIANSLLALGSVVN